MKIGIMVQCGVKKMSNIDPRVHDILKEYHDNPKEAVWHHKQSNQWIAKHKDLELVAARAGIEFNEPVILQIDLEKKIVALCVTGTLKERKEWSIGEATSYNSQNNYYCAMAEKRAKDRVILKLLGLHGFVYSDEEIDSAKQDEPKKSVNEKVKEAVNEAIDDKRTKAEAWVNEYLKKIDAIEDVNRELVPLQSENHAWLKRIAEGYQDLHDIITKATKVKRDSV